MFFRLEVAARRGPRARREILSKNTGIARPLEIFGIEHQPQLARVRWGLVTIRFETLGLLVLRIRNELEIVLPGWSIGRLRWPARAGAGSQGPLPQTAVAENLLDHVVLTAILTHQPVGRASLLN